MGASGQLHIQTSLPPGKEPPVLTGYKARWGPRPDSTFWRKEKSLSPAGIEPQLTVTTLAKLGANIQGSTRRCVKMQHAYLHHAHCSVPPVHHALPVSRDSHQPSHQTSVPILILLLVCPLSRINSERQKPQVISGVK